MMWRFNRERKLRIAAHVMILARTTARLWNQVDLRQTTLKLWTDHSN
jgi:hypothetical protein